MHNLHEDRTELLQTNAALEKKIDQLLLAAFKEIERDRDHSLNVFMSALAMAEQADNQSEQLYCRLMLGVYYNTIGKIDPQERAFAEAAEFQASLPVKAAVQALVRFGAACSSSGRNDYAIKYLLLGIDLCTEPDTLPYRARFFNHLGISYARIEDYTKAQQYLQQALELSYEINDLYLRTLIWNNLGNIHRLQSEMPKALEYYSKALVAARQQENNRTTALSLNNIGTVYAVMGEYVDALEHLLRCETLQQYDIVDEKIYSNTLNSIGNLYEKMLNYDKALEYYKKSIAIRELYNDVYLQADSLHNIGIIYQLKGEYDAAYEHYRQSLQLRESIGDNKGIALSLNGLGQILTIMDNTEEAMNYHMRSIAIAEAANNQIDKVYFLVNMSETLLKQSDIPGAFEYLFLALTIAEKTGNPIQRREIYHSLSEAYRLDGNTEQALEYFMRFHNMDKEIFSTANSQKIQNLQTLHQVEQTRQETEIYRLKNVELATALANLEQANARLTILNNEKNELLNIVAHDLKNPLSSVMMLADILMKDEVLTMEEVREFSGDILASSERMFTLITNLLEVNSLENLLDDGIKLHAIDVVSLLRHTARQYIAQAEKKDITILQEYSDEYLIASSEQEALMQVLDNLVSNAVKFSPIGKNVIIRATTLTTADNRPVIRIEIQDEGPGLSQEDQSKLFKKFTRLSAQPTGGEHSTGLGLSIVKRQVELLHGLVWCESLPGYGAKFIVELPADSDNPTSSL